MNPFPHSPYSMTDDELGQALATVFVEMHGRGRKIEAIKQVRSAVGCGLKEAKDIIDIVFASLDVKVASPAANSWWDTLPANRKVALYKENMAPSY